MRDRLVTSPVQLRPVPAARTLRRASAAVAVAAATVASAAGDSGTSSVGDMSVSGSMLGAMFGGLAALGVVIWLVTKLMNR